MILYFICGLQLAGCAGGAVAREAQQPVRVIPRSKMPPGTAAMADVTIAAGKLERHRSGSELFQIDELWIRVAEDTEFHRWLSQGVDRQVALVLTANTARLADEAGMRILTGKLIHQTAPNPTPNTVDVVGQLPPGNLPMVHIVFLRDELTATIGAVTLQTSDRETASRFEGFDDALVSIVIRIE
jgi:hypothetical protein